MIELVDLHKLYTTTSVQTVALNKVSLSIDEGDFVSIMGPSGCGKSTLMNILGLIDHPTSGDYNLFGENVSKASEKRKADLRKANIGFIFQSFNLLDELSVFQNVELPLIYTKLSSSERRKKVDALLERLNIAHRRNHKPRQLSGGQQQRVAIARAMVNAPKIILADEPTGNLDSANSTDVMELLTELNQEGTSILMVTHSATDANYSKRTIHLFDGELITEQKLKQYNYA